MSQFKVLLCSDLPLYGQSLSVAFDENYIFRVVESVNYHQLMEASLRLQPDVVVINLNDEEALGLLSELKNNCPMLLPVVIVDDPDRFNMIDIINRGVRGCLPIRLLPRQIVNAVELIVVAGLLCLPRVNLHSNSFKGNGAQEKHIETIGTLTSREREILILLCRGLANQEIAESLSLAESTVKTHLRNAFHKLQVRNRAEAIALLLGSDVVNCDQPA